MASPDEIKRALGLPDNATDDDVREAVARWSADGGTGTSPVPPGAIAVAASVWEETQRTIRSLSDLVETMKATEASEGPRLDQSVTVRWSTEEVQRIDRAARAEGRSRGDLIRRIVNEALGPPGVPALVRPPSELQERMVSMERELESLKNALRGSPL